MGLPGLPIGISAGTDHNLAVMSDGTVQGWGNNGAAQLGNGATALSQPNPVPMSGLPLAARAVAGGTVHSAVLLIDGSARATGLNGNFQLGDGTQVFRTTPVPVIGLSGARALVAGGGHNLAVLGDGSVRAWGQNDFGQVGDGLPGDRGTPVPVAPAATPGPVHLVDAGGWHSLALLGNGGGRAWGRNTWGQLGDGTFDSRGTPVPISGLAGASAISGNSFHSVAPKQPPAPSGCGAG
jgi:alpha-tubulin suppressor-like RCC1 family protein